MCDHGAIQLLAVASHSNTEVHFTISEVTAD